MNRLLTILIAVGLAVLFGEKIPLLRMFDAFQPMIVALSIMIAAVLVRLNRGMPPLEWKSIDPGRRSQLTSRIVDLVREYITIAAINAGMLVYLVSLITIGKSEIRASWSEQAQFIASALVGFGLGLCFARMGYVIWRDLDIVKLQKAVIDSTASKDAEAGEVAAAAEKIVDIKAAGLRKIPTPEPKAWGK